MTPPPTTVPYKAVDGLEILADVYVPPDAADGPAVLYLHPGALIMGDRTWVPPADVAAFTGAGLTVASIDYRLAPETKLPAILSDIEDAWAWMRGEGAARFRFDPDRVAVAGGSAGGYLALWAGAGLEPRPRALASFYGYGDLTGPWYTEPSAFYNQEPSVTEEEARGVVGTDPISEDPTGARRPFYLRTRQQGIWPQEVGGRDPDDRQWFAAFEPVRHVTPDFPPTMLLHGVVDTDVPFELSVGMRDELARHGVAHELVSHPEWDHVFDFALADDPDVQEAVGRAAAFLIEHTAPRP